MSYSVGRAGTYHLHVALRQQARVLPGAPFLLHVLPGPASHHWTGLSTAMPLPLHSSAGDTSPSQGVPIISRDSSNNRCVLGGAPLHASSEGPAPLTCKIDDHADGSYSLHWEAIERPGKYRIHVVSLAAQAAHRVGYIWGRPPP